MRKSPNPQIPAKKVFAYAILCVAAAIFLIIRLANRLQRLRPSEKPAPTTKECPYCISNIPIKATRCPNCTSEIK